MALERDIERRHRKIAMADGWLVEKIMLTGRRGFPDRFYAKNGRVVLIEFKQPGKVLTKLQEMRHAELTAAGVEVYTVTSEAEANRALGIR